MFFRGMPLLPPRAGMTPSTVFPLFMRKVVEPLLLVELDGCQDVSNARTGVLPTVDIAPFVPSMLDLSLNRRTHLHRIVSNIDDIRPTESPFLTASDVHGWNAQVRA